MVLSMGLGVMAVAPGFAPGQAMQVHASETTGSLPEPNTNPFTDASDEAHYKFLNQRALMTPEGGVNPWKVSMFPLDTWMQATDLEEIDGATYATVNINNTGDVYRYNDTTEKWEPLGVNGKPLNVLVKSANGNMIAAGGYSNDWGEYYALYSSIGDDSSFEKRIDVYRSGTSSTNPSNAGIFKAGVAVEDETLMFGKSKNWTNIMTTTDDINFDYKQQIYGDYEDAIYAGGKVVAVGSQLPSGNTKYGSIAVSLPDGKFTVTKLGYNEDLQSVTYANGKYVAVGKTGSLQPVVYTSIDGVTWTKTPMPTNGTGLNVVAWDEVNQRFVAAGRLGAMYMSLDGVDWIPVLSGLGSDVFDLEMIEDPTARMTLSNEAGNVTATYESLVEGASSYEVTRNGEVIYSGTELSYTDTETVGEKKYTYQVKVKDVNGEVIGTKSQTLTTSSYASLSAEYGSGEVVVSMDYMKDEAVTYEVVRDGETLYTGGNGSFVDSALLGAMVYNYTLNVKDADGNVLASDSYQVATPIQNPTNVQAEVTSPTSQNVSWTDDKNREDTEYFVQANPLGEVDPTPVTLVEGFESETPLFESTGDWERSTLNKADGENSLKSAVIGHRGMTTSTYTIDVPETVLDGKVSFDYLVSSEANYDWFRVVLNGKQVVRQSGISTWKSVEFNLQPGENTLMFEYKKDGSGVRGSDAAFIDNLTATSADNGVRTSGWIQEKEHEFQGLTAGIPYEFTVVAKANGLESEIVSSLDVSNPTAEVTENVAGLVNEIANLDLSNLEAIADAQTQLDAVRELVWTMPESAEKDSLIAQIADLQEQLDNAKAVVEATQAVDSFIDALPEELATQEAIGEATAGLNEVQELVEALVDSEEKAALVERLTEVETSIQLAQDILNATEAITELMDAVATIETQEAIDEALALLEDAKALVSLLPADNTARVELEKELAEAQKAIDVAQAVLDVAKLADAPTQAEIDQARASLEKVEAGALKDSLLEKIELAQAVLDAQTLLAEIATREIDTTEQVDQAIADLKSTDELIASLEGTFMDGETSALEQAYNKAKKHIADEFLALLEDNKNQKGKKEKLSISDASLHLLVQQLVAENPEITKGEIKGQLQPLLASFVNGNELNDVIAVYVN